MRRHGAAWRLIRNRLLMPGVIYLHPALLDASLQMVIETVADRCRNELYVPIGVDRIDREPALGSRYGAWCAMPIAATACCEPISISMAAHGTPLTVLGRLSLSRDRSNVSRQDGLCKRCDGGLGTRAPPEAAAPPVQCLAAAGDFRTAMPISLRSSPVRSWSGSSGDGRFDQGRSGVLVPLDDWRRQWTLPERRASR